MPRICSSKPSYETSRLLSSGPMVIPRKTPAVGLRADFSRNTFRVTRRAHTSASCRLIRLKANVFQCFRLLQLCFAGGKLVHVQNVRQDIGLFLDRDFSRFAFGHGKTNFVEQFAHRQAVPALQELLAREGWSIFMSGELVTVTGGTFAIIERFAALGLLGGVDAIPHGMWLLRMSALLL